MDKLILRDRIKEIDYLEIEEDGDLGVFLTVYEWIYGDLEPTDASLFLSYESLRSLRNWINELLDDQINN